MSTPKINPEHAVDLAEVSRLAEQARVEDAAKQRADDEAKARAWHRAMKRTFKGTGFTPWDRRNFLRQALRQMQREADES